jgi:tetratricopeptide (TPR) repeat protein
MAVRVTRRRLRRWLRDRAGLSTLLGLKSRDRDLLAWEAHSRLLRGSIDEAEAVYRAMLALWANLPTAHFGLGACLQSKGDLAGAEAEYSEVLLAEPNNLYALADRAEVRLLTGRPLDALDDIRAAKALPARSLRRARLVDRVEALRSMAEERVIATSH